MVIGLGAAPQFINSETSLSFSSSLCKAIIPLNQISSDWLLLAKRLVGTAGGGLKDWMFLIFNPEFFYFCLHQKGPRVEETAQK